ncbi:putative FAD-linked sulfhydryl oxidase [Tupanvirus deep ocean]|uniref:FAD-linked sulfhydryl oxidase n=2 Tax=Tupanvirus TaxID=2094720 RepID=A0AC62A834_9VIRU|nr:putative FAD-linked sulfhydryl oxidase [Tupanvirus deep ocean]QKU33937.1 putative FAD-linked sulfhydryl oxidase [Tupanvirus deep ocean]
MLPEIWGKYAWNFLHLVTLDYPEYPTDQDKQNYYNFFYTLQFVLPCAKCRYNLTHHLKKYPLTDEVLSSRTNLVKWGIDLHNVVNYYTGKPMLTYTEAMNELNKLAHPEKTTFTDVLYVLLVIVALIIMFYLLYYFFVKPKKLNI